MRGAIFRPHSNCNHINTNTIPNPKPNPDPVNTKTNLNPNPNNPDHNHTLRMENRLEPIQLSVPGDGKYHCYFPSGTDKLYMTGAIFHPWRQKIYSMRQNCFDLQQRNLA